MDDKLPNRQDIVKLFAIICMFIDHVGLFFFPYNFTARAIGRFAFPIFAFYAGYNYKGSVNQRVLLYGARLYVYSVFVIFQGFIPANILISIVIGQLYLYIFDTHKISKFVFYLHLIVLFYFWSLSRQYFEYGSITCFIMLVAQYYKHNKITAGQAAWYVLIPTVITSHILFGAYFNKLDYFIFLLSMYCLFHVIRNSDNQFSTCGWSVVRTISRNSLLIYVIHIAVIMFVWRYIVR